MGKVIDLFAATRKKEIKEKIDHLLDELSPKENGLQQEKSDQDKAILKENKFSFDEIEKENKLKELKMEKLRLSLNDKVKRSYNLNDKPKKK